jgi:hypothetical protein
MKKQIFNFLASVALVALTYQTADAITLVTSDDCRGISEYKELALNQKSKKNKTRKTSTHTQTRKVELPSSWELMYMMMGQYEYCCQTIETDNMTLYINLYKNGINLTVIPGDGSQLPGSSNLPASCKLTVGEDVYTVKNDGYDEYSLDVTDTATINKIINYVAAGDCVIKFDNGQKKIDFPATGEFAKDIKQAYKWVNSISNGMEI